MLTGKTTLIAHLGYPTATFKAPIIYKPWFERRGIDAIVVPIGVKAQDYYPLPFDVERIAPGTFVGEVVMKSEYTPLLRAMQARGCPVQVGTDMLFEMIPAYLEFFGFGAATPDELRAVARIQY
jgi:shikimate dehydrogenase